ncbi:S8 family peptidase [Flavobacteriales bacterium]|nr:S8 family peptidase [Flavobacteriales bacterium]
MKNKSLLQLSILLFLTLYGNLGIAQFSNIWGSVDNIEALKASEDFIEVSNQFDISIEQILPSSRKPALLKVFEFSCNCNETDLYIALTKVSKIENIEYGPKYETLVLPNDYHLAFSNMYALDLINAEDAWSMTHGDPTVGVAISDQNYDVSHEELVGSYIYYDASNTSSTGHGTAVATMVAGNTNNALGFSSIGYDLNLGLYQMNINEALNASYAGAQVINLSWTSGCTYNAFIQDAVNEIYDNGTFIVAAAGNGPTCGGASNLVYPASYDNVFAVTSIGNNDNHEKIIGNPSSTHQHNVTVDLCAPGYDVPITAAPGWYLHASGTSYAAPLVTGTVGLMLSVNPCLTNLEIETFLKLSSVNVDAQNPSYIGLIGTGRLDAAAAVLMALNSPSITYPCGTIACDPSQSANAGACQTVFWGYTNDYAEVELNGFTSGGNGVTTSTWTDQYGNIMGTGNNISFLSDASTVSPGGFNTATYNLIHTDEFGCTVSDDVQIITYNVKCPNPSGNPAAEKILVCGKKGRRCVPYNAVDNILANCSGCSLGPCKAIPDCKSNSTTSTSYDFETSTIKVYPNPSTGIVNIRTEDNQNIDRIEVYNHLGQLIESQENSSFFTVDLTNQKSGIFLIKSHFGNQMKSTVISSF